MPSLFDTGIFSIGDNGTGVGAGWKLNFYTTGTSSRLDTYPTSADASAGTNANANPVVADAYGRLPAVWLLDQTYKAVLTDAAGVVKVTRDPINSPLGASGGSASVGFLQSGTGAVTRTVQSKLRDTVNVKDFGAAVDGTTDDTTAFQNAINTGKDVILAPGTMVIGLITMANNDQRVVGTRACTLKHKSSTTGNLITISGASCSLIGFNIDGNSSGLAYSYNAREVYVSGAKAEIRGLRISNAQSHAIGMTKGALQAVIVDNEIQTCGDFGVFVDGNSGSGSDPAYGVCENNVVVDFGLQGGGSGATTSVGIGIRSSTGGWRVANNLVRNTASRTNDQLGIECWTNSNNVVVEGNTVDGSVASSMEFGISVTGYGSIVSGNLILGTASYGIEVIDRAVAVTGNILRSPTGAGISVNLNSGHTDPGDLISITGNTVENTSSTSASFAAIVVAGNPGVTPIGITITGNTCHGLSNGIVVTSLVTGYTISGNTLYNTGSTMTGIAALGADGTVIGNTVYRVSSAGTGNGGHITIDGSGHLVGLNRISGNGRIDNGILINSTATNALLAMNMITGCTNAVFSNSTDSSIVVQSGMGSVGLTLNAANYAEGWFNTTNKSVTNQKMPVPVGTWTAATLPTSGVIAGTIAYCTDANATTQNAIVAGGGANNVIVAYDGAAWRIG